jgi:hypothetical protein
MVVEKRFFHCVSLEGPIEVRPSDENNYVFRKLYVETAGKHIWYRQDVDIGEEVKALELKPLPERPKAPTLLLSGWQIEDAERRARRAVFHGQEAEEDSQEEIPF